MKPGDLVKFDHPANPTPALVKSVHIGPTQTMVLVQWCNEREAEEYLPETSLKSLTNTQSIVI